MKLVRIGLFIGFILLLLLSGFIPLANQNPTVLAQAGLTPTATAQPPRKAHISLPITQYRWWLIRYTNNNIVCSFIVEHAGMPTTDDIINLCDKKTSDEWQTTAPCDIGQAGSYDRCPGFYLQAIESTPGERQIDILLPLPSAWISISNCNARPPANNRCTTLPSINIIGEEPLPNESIISIQGAVNGEPFTCMGSTCSVPLKPTGMDGTIVTFWADSSFGDATEHYTARVRLVPWGDFMNPEQISNDPQQWYVDVLSSQWRDGKQATCSDKWQVFPGINGPPEWLSPSATTQDLQSDTSYYYLAGSLITYGEVDASGCLDGGLQAPNIASSCGVEAARSRLVEWQNRFDDEIVKAANDTGIPAHLLKNVFARESQIWPGIYTSYKEAGLGQLTENGADTMLLWNPAFYHQYCPLVLNQKYCEIGFAELDAFEQGLLRGSLVQKVDASCPDCPAGIDIADANYSVNVFARGLLANCEQVGQVITDATGLGPAETSSYDDLWRFTLVNYNAGPGCLYNAVRLTDNANQPIDWTNVSSHLDPTCQKSIGYVEDITQMLKITPTATVWVPNNENLPTPVMPRVLNTPTPTPQPFARTGTPAATSTTTFAPTATITRTAAITPTATATLGPGTPSPTSASSPTVTGTP